MFHFLFLFLFLDQSFIFILQKSEFYDNLIIEFWIEKYKAEKRRGRETQRIDTGTVHVEGVEEILCDGDAEDTHFF